MTSFAESALEQTTLHWFKNLGCAIILRDAIVPENPLASLRDSLLPKLMRGEVRVNYD